MFVIGNMTTFVIVVFMRSNCPKLQLVLRQDNTLDDGGFFGEDIVEDDEKEEKEDDDEDGDEEKEDGDGGDDDELDKAIDTSEDSKKGGKRRKRESRVDKAGDFSFLRDESFTEVNLNVSKVKNLRKKKRLFGSERHVEGVEDERERWLLRMVKVEKRKKKLKEGEQEPDEIKFDVNRKPHVHKVISFSSSPFF